MNFKNIHLPIAYRGRNKREIFLNSDLVGMNRRDSNLMSSKNRRVSHLEKWIARGYRPKLLKFSLFSSGNAHASLRITFLANSYLFDYDLQFSRTLGKNDVSFFRKIPKFYKKLSSKPVVLCRVLLAENTVVSSIKRLGSPM